MLRETGINRLATSLKDKILYAKGILNKKIAYQGPNFLELHIINDCNVNCVGCYYHSCRKNNRFSPEWKEQRIKTDDFFRIIDEAEKMKIRNITLTGGGEPFMHPDILQFIKYIKRKVIGCTVSTNGTLIDEEVLHVLSLSKLDLLTVSLWDSNVQRYEELRPGHKQKLEDIKSWLRFHKKKKMIFPKINVIYVLNNRNYNSILEMYEFAKEYGIERITFKPFIVYNIYKDTTQDFLLSQEQIAPIIEQLKEISRINKGRIITNIDDFCRFLKGVHVEGHHYINNFFRRIPCYIGWFYMVIFLNGDVIPCCGCRRYILGNIYQNKLSEIWNSKIYQEFRYYALTDKSLTIFNNFGCGTMCPFYYINLRVNKYFDWLIQTNGKTK